MSFFIDTHCHLNHPDYSESDLSLIIDKMIEGNFKALVVGYDLVSSKKALELAIKYPNNLRAVVGIHPVSAKKTVSHFEPEILDLAKHDLVVGIGECGFDYNHLNREETFILQKNLLEKHIDISLSLNKPLMFHLRNGRNDQLAYTDLIEIIKNRAVNNQIVKGNVHFFTGSLESAKEFSGLGLQISLTGVVTYSQQFDDLIRDLEIENFTLETDSPWVSPNPVKSELNTPLNVYFVYEYVAAIKNVPIEELKAKIELNVARQYGF